MASLEFTVEGDGDTGVLVATWNDHSGGGITTEADTLANLERSVQEAVRCHFDAHDRPREVRLHFSSDLVVQVA